MENFKFGWMKRTPCNLHGKSVFSDPSVDAESLQTEDENIAAKGDWRTLLKDAKSQRLESNIEKFKRLYDEGSSLAEEGRFGLKIPCE